MQDRDFGGALIGSTNSAESEIHCSKNWVNDVLSMQIHVASFKVTDKHLKIQNVAYKQIATNAATVSNNVVNCYVRKIYGSM